MPQPELERLVGVMHRLRAECPWDAEQTHLSLVKYLVEETLEVVEAIEAGSDHDLVEELGDLLLQVVFHAEIAAGESRFDLEDVARGIADKLIARHPYVFSDQPVPDDLLRSWEQRKRAEKGRTSVLDGIPQQLSALTRAAKVLARSDWQGPVAPRPIRRATSASASWPSLPKPTSRGWTPSRRPAPPSVTWSAGSPKRN